MTPKPSAAHDSETANDSSPMIRGAVLGQNVEQSQSPAIHEAAFAALGIKGSYEAISLPAAGFQSRVRALAESGYRYVNVTIPHKKLAARMATTRAQAVEMTGAANTLVFKKDRNGNLKIHADNTDGYGLLTALSDVGVDIAQTERPCVIMVGAGGAAAGALLALARAGAHITLMARRRAPALVLRRRLTERLRRRVAVVDLNAQNLAETLLPPKGPVPTALISAVPAAAWEPADLRHALRCLQRKTAVLEMAYGGRTPLALEARRHTMKYQDGIPMLVHQAARAIKVALNQDPPTQGLFEAVREPD